MSRKYVRDKFKAYLATNYTVNTQKDLSAVTSSTQLPTGTFVGIDFQSSQEIKSGLNSCYKETGVIALHYVTLSSSNSDNDASAIVDATKVIRDLLRNVRIDDIILLEINPPEFQVGFPFEMTGKISATINISYERNFVVNN